MGTKSESNILCTPPLSHPLPRPRPTPSLNTSVPKLLAEDRQDEQLGQGEESGKLWCWDLGVRAWMEEESVHTADGVAAVLGHQPHTEKLIKQRTGVDRARFLTIREESYKYGKGDDVE